MTHKHSTDETLVVAMAAGDAEALSELYRRYHRLVGSITNSVLRSQAEAEETAQEVFVELWRRAAKFDRRRGTVAAWVSRLAKCRSIDAYRARQSRGGGKTADIDDCPISCSSPSAQRRVEQGQDSDLVRGAVAQLSPVLRATVELAYFDGLTHGEIAESLAIPVGTVKSRMAAAFVRLRSSLKSAAQPQLAYA